MDMLKFRNQYGNAINLTEYLICPNKCTASNFIKILHCIKMSVYLICPNKCTVCIVCFSALHAKSTAIVMDGQSATFLKFYTIFKTV